MANYADGARTPRTLTEREQRALLKVTGEHRAGFKGQGDGGNLSTCLLRNAKGTRRGVGTDLPVGERPRNTQRH